MLQTSSDHHSSVNAPLAVDLSSSHHIASFLSLEKGKPWMVCSLEKNNHSYGEQFQIKWELLKWTVWICDRPASCKHCGVASAPPLHEDPELLWTPLLTECLQQFVDRSHTGYLCDEHFGKKPHYTKLEFWCISTISDCDLCNLSLNHLHDANEPIVGASVKRGCWALGFLVERCFRSNFTVFTFDFFFEHINISFTSVFSTWSMLIRSRCCHMFTSCLDTKGVEVFRNVQRRPTLRGLPICVCPTGQQEFQCSIVTKVRGDMYCIDLFGRHKDAAIAQDRNIYVLLIHKAQHPHLLEANHRSEMTGLILPYIYEFTCLHRIYIYIYIYVLCI